MKPETLGTEREPRATFFLNYRKRAGTGNIIFENKPRFPSISGKHVEVLTRKIQ